jgi:hypothetical protein
METLGKLIGLDVPEPFNDAFGDWATWHQSKAWGRCASASDILWANLT